MKAFSIAFKVGFVVLLGTLMLMAMIFKFSAKWGQEGGTYELYAIFDDVTGLTKRSQVRIAGIQVGEIVSIDLAIDKAKVRFRVKDDVVLYSGIDDGTGFYVNGVTIAKKMSGLMGDHVLELTTGIRGDVLKDGDRVHNVVTNVGAEALLTSVGKIVKDINGVTTSLNEVFGGAGGVTRFTGIMNNAQSITDNINGMIAENRHSVQKTIGNIEKTTQEVHKIFGDNAFTLASLLTKTEKISDQLDRLLGNTDQNLDRSFDKLVASLDQLNKTMKNVENITADLNSGQGTIGKLLKDESIANNADRLLADTRALIRQGTETVNDVNELLSPISDLQTEVSLRNDFMINANSFKNIFGIKLQPSPNKWYLLQVVSDTRGSSKTTHRLVSSTGSAPVYEKIEETDTKMKFSFNFAGRWKFLAGRFGIIENTGGIGGNLYLFDDNIEFAADIFDLSANKYPRFRAYGLMYFDLFMPWSWSDNLYLSAGIDDPFNKKVFDYFFGIGFSFTDRHIKSLMGILPKP